MKLIDKKLAALKAAQENGTYTLCPRCGRPAMKPNLYTNALSRAADIMVCDDCGVDEAKLAFMKAPGSLYAWSGLQPEKPASDFGELSGRTVWERLCKEQVTTLMRLFDRFNEGEDPDEIRLAAFESCPGLTEFWTEPYRMDFTASDGRVVVRFRKTDTGTEMTGAMIESEECK